MTDAIRLSLMQVLRAYAVRAPTERGLGRVEHQVSVLAKSLTGSHSLVVDSIDGRHFRVDPREPQYHMGLLARGTFEPNVTRMVEACVRPGHVTVDVGANFGWFTTLFSRLVTSTGQVHAFEPLHATFETLRTNCGLNDPRNVHLNNVALSDEAGETSIHYFPGEPIGNASLYSGSNRPAVSSTCKLMTLDSYAAAKGMTRCDFIKCDAEGAELKVLRGGAEVMSAMRPIVLIELNPYTCELAGYRAVDLLLEIGNSRRYRFFEIPKRGPVTEVTDPARYVFDGYINALCVPEESTAIAAVTKSMG